MFYICNCIIVILYIPRHVVRVNKSYLILSYLINAVMITRRWQYYLSAAMITRWHYCISGDRAVDKCTYVIEQRSALSTARERGNSHWMDSLDSECV